MEQTLLVSTEYIKSRSPIFENVSDKLLREAIYDSQLMYIEQILGTSLYNSIIAEVDAGNVSADNKILLDNYIINTLKFYALKESTVFVTNSFTPTGVKKLTQDSSVEVTQNVLKAYESKWGTRAEFWAQRAIKFLCAESNLGKYPLYNAGTGRVDEVTPVRTQYRSSFYLGGGGNNCTQDWIDERNA